MVSLVFVGNCQIQAMHGLYTRFCEAAAARDIHYIRSYDSLSDADHTCIEHADILVQQVQEFKPQAEIASVHTHADRIAVPLVHCGFYWPFAGQPHPNNPILPHMATGPYGAEMSDGFLNRHIKRGTPAEPAVAEYLALDVNQVVMLDRLREVVLEKQAMRDSATGFDLASLMAEHFRTEQIFLTPFHPNLRVALALASQTLSRLGMLSSELAVMRRATRETPFPKDELPVHPAVARHWELTWAAPERRYNFLNEGGFTFLEYTRRYVRCEWNAELEHGLLETRAGNWPVALDALNWVVTATPGVAAAHSALAHVLSSTGRHDEALRESERAASIKPESAAYQVQFAVLLERQGNPDDAERRFRLAAALEAYDPHYPGMLASFLHRTGRLREAKAVAEAGLECAPRAVNLLLSVGDTSKALGEWGAARAAFDRAAEIDPQSTSALIGIASVIEAAGDFQGAVAPLRKACSLQPDDVTVQARLAKALEASGQPGLARGLWQRLSAGSGSSAQDERQRAETLFGAGQMEEALAVAYTAMERFPDEIGILRVVFAALDRLGRFADEVGAIREALLRQPASGELHFRLGDALIRTGDFATAERAFQTAAAILPANAHVLGQLGFLLDRRGDHDGAIRVRMQACEIDPANPYRRAQLGHVLASAGRFDEAEATMRAALAQHPEDWNFHIELADVLARAGQPVSAALAAEQALALAPGEPRALEQLAQARIATGRWEEAETLLLAATATAPPSDRARELMSRLSTVQRDNRQHARSLDQHPTEESQ